MPRTITKSSAVVALIAGSLAALAGCGKSQPSGPAAAASGSAATPAATTANAPATGLPLPQPGLYRSTVKLLGIDGPNLPPQAVERMREAMGRKSEPTTYCLTPEEAKRGYETRVRKLAGRPDCHFAQYAAAGSNLDARLECAGQGLTATLTMHGTMSPTGSDVTMVVNQAGPQMPDGGITMRMQVRSERVGGCP